MNHVTKLLKIADGAYPDGLIERIRKGEEEVGDGLAKFIATEIKETAEGKTPKQITERVVKALETAAQELDSVLYALRQIKHRPEKKQLTVKLQDFTVYWERKGSKTYKAKNEKAAEVQFLADPTCQYEEQTTDISTLKGGK